MDLWIRSQDKNWLTPIDDIISVFQKSVFHKGDILGQYKSDERALEVLDEIQRMVTPSILQDKQFLSYVYEMPKE